MKNLFIMALLLTCVSVQAQIGPLLTTTWNQNTPFNDLCPTDKEVVDIIRANDAEYGLNTPIGDETAPMGYGGHCPTGCVPTAVAQIMNYWQWPKQGSLSHTQDNIIKLHGDFYQSTYDWDSMLDHYDNYAYRNYTDEQGQAVAQLMADLGIALDAFYRPTDTGVGSMKPYTALLQYFGYSNDIRYYRNLSMNNVSYDGDDENFVIKITSDDIPAILREELDAGRPVLCNVPANGIAHAVVCDGYNSDGLFHYNYGMGGENDGYEEHSFIIDIIAGIHPAEKEQVGGVWYELKGDEAVAAHPNGSSDYTGDIAIESSVTIVGNTLPVTDIAKFAFKGKDIDRISIPGSIRQIPIGTFKGCAFLTSVTLANGIQTIGRQAFYGDKNLTIVDGTWGSQLKEIGEEAFGYCQSLWRIPDFMSSNLRIGEAAFLNCRIGSLRFTGRGAILETRSFLNNEVSVQGWENVAEIGPAAFNKLAEGEFVVSTTTNYAEEAVSGQIGRIVIPAAAKNYIHANSVTGTAEYVVEQGHPLFSSRGGMLLSQDCTELLRVPEWELANDGHDLTERYMLVIPPCVNKVGKDVVSYAVKLLTIPTSVKLLDGALDHCSPQLITCLSPTPPTLIYNKDYGFSETKMRVPHGSKSTYAQTAGWKLIPNITDDELSVDGQFCYRVFPSDGEAQLIGRISDVAFDGHARIPSTTTFEGTKLDVTDLGEYAFAYDDDVMTVTLPTSMSFATGMSFIGCDNLNAILVDAGNEIFSSINGMLLRQMYNGKTLIFCPPMRSEGGKVESRSTVILPDEVECIGNGSEAFASNLQSIILPGFLRWVNRRAFFNSPNLRTIRCLGTEPPYVNLGEAPFLIDTYNTATLYVPKGYLAIYKTAYEWRDFVDIREFDSTSVESITVGAQQSAKAYNLQGQRVTDGYRGIVIINGKKIMK